MHLIEKRIGYQAYWRPLHKGGEGARGRLFDILAEGESAYSREDAYSRKYGIKPDRMWEPPVAKAQTQFIFHQTKKF